MLESLDKHIPVGFTRKSSYIHNSEKSPTKNITYFADRGCPGAYAPDATCIASRYATGVKRYRLRNIFGTSTIHTYGLVLLISLKLYIKRKLPPTLRVLGHHHHPPHPSSHTSPSSVVYVSHNVFHFRPSFSLLKIFPPGPSIRLIYRNFYHLFWHEIGMCSTNIIRRYSHLRISQSSDLFTVM